MLFFTPLHRLAINGLFIQSMCFFNLGFMFARKRMVPVCQHCALRGFFMITGFMVLCSF